MNVFFSLFSDFEELNPHESNKAGLFYSPKKKKLINLSARVETDARLETDAVSK